MAVLKSIQVEILEQRIYPNKDALLQNIQVETLPVFATPNRAAVLLHTTVETVKSRITAIEFNTLLPFATSSNYNSVELIHPQEPSALSLNYGGNQTAINQYFGYDPDEVSVSLVYTGSANDLITAAAFSINPTNTQLKPVIQYE